MTVSYDATGKPATIVTPKGTQQNIYDASGNLLLSVDPVTGATLYNGDTELHQAVGSTQVSATRTYTGANNTPVAERDTIAGQSGNTLYWLFTDVDGTVTAQANATTGTIVHRYTDPFGNVEGSAPSGWADNHGYLNKVDDTDTGLILVGARDYDTELGKFTSVDPILAPMNPLQDNGYSYANSSPVTNADSSGECYTAGSDSLSHATNCAGGHGANAMGAAPSPGSWRPDPVPNWARTKGYNAPDDSDFALPLAIGARAAGAAGEAAGAAAGATISAAAAWAIVLAGILSMSGDTERQSSHAAPINSSASTPATPPECDPEEPFLDCINASEGKAGDQSLSRLFADGPPRASDLESYAQGQGWTRSQSVTGPVKYYDENGIERMVIKRGSARTAGSENPHVSLRNSDGDRVDPWGGNVSRSSPGNHTAIIWDLP